MMNVGLPLYFTGMSDAVYNGEDKAVRRRCITTTFWAIGGTGILSFGYTLIMERLVGDDNDGVNPLVALSTILSFILGMVSLVVLFLFSNIFVCVTHKKMRKVSLYRVSHD